MRSKEEIEAIANEIHRNVQRKLACDDAKRILKKYGPNCLSVVGLAACIPVMSSRQMATVAETIVAQKTLKDYKERIAEQFSIKPE